MLIIFFFFFQAEDGIRDLIVTGVQTCALPISQEAVSQALLDVLPFGRADGRDQAPDVADVVIASLDAQEVSRCLALLPEQQRLSIVLMDVAGYTARETAEVLGCPRGTVLARVHRGRRRLAQLLAEAGVSHGQP